LLPPSKFKNTIIEKSLISEGCIFECKRKQSVIGIRSRVGEGTVIQNCYVMGIFYQSINDMNADINNSLVVGERCFISHAIVDKNCRIGDDILMEVKHLDDVSHDLYAMALL
jgi:glucose-1-phosphate adenylyltransferase